MVLYDRIRLSARNEWTRDGKVYTFYPVADLAQALHKSERMILRALDELESGGLLMREHHGFNQPNAIFLMLPDGTNDAGNVTPGPDKSVISDMTKMSDPTCQKCHPNKVIYTSNNSHTIKAYGVYANVLLTEQAYADLKQELGGQLGGLIDRMSRYVHRTGKRYTDYASALRRWAEQEPAWEQPVRDPYDMDIPYEEGSSL